MRFADDKAHEISISSSFDHFAGFGTLHFAGCRTSLGRSLSRS